MQEMTDLQQKVDEVRLQVQKVLAEANLAVEDVKGVKVDASV